MLKKLSVGAFGAALCTAFLEVCVFAQSSQAAAPGMWDILKGYGRLLGGILLVMLGIYFIAVLTGKIGQKGGKK